MLNMIFHKIRDVNNPNRANTQDSWIDFYTPNDMETLYIQPGQNVLIPLWVKIELNEWYDLTFFNKSGIASKTWLIVWACVIDNWYRWELILNLINTSSETRTILPWMKIVQWIIRKCEYILPTEWIVNSITDRWEGWFWSTWIL